MKKVNFLGKMLMVIQRLYLIGLTGLVSNWTNKLYLIGLTRLAGKGSG